MLNKKTLVFWIIIFLVCLLIYINLNLSKYFIRVVPSPASKQSTVSATFKPDLSNVAITYAKVIKVIDGDTIVIDTGQHVRYIGMNTPEIETNECYASESSEINKNLVLGKTVKLIKDISETDKYDRLLRYVYVDSTFIDDYLVKDGAARVMTVQPDTKYKVEFTNSENYAKENKLGLWGKCL